MKTGDHFSEYDETKLSKLDKDVSILQVNVNTLSANFHEFKDATKKDIDSLYEDLDKKKDQIQELQGKISQLKMQMTDSVEKKNAAKTRFLTNYLYPLLLSATMVLVRMDFQVMYRHTDKWLEYPDAKT